MKNTMIALVGKNNAVVMTEKSYKKGQYKLFTASSSMAAGLMAMEYLLNTASDNTTIDKDVLAIYIPDTLKGFAGKAYVEYIRTGKTASGRAFNAEEKELVLKVATLLCNKGLNVRATESKYMTRDLAEFRNTVLNLAKDLKVNTPAPQQTQATSTQADPVAAIGLQIAEAAAKGDMATVTALTAALTALKAAQAPAPQSTTNESVVPDYIKEEMDRALELSEEIVNEECEPEEELNVDEDIANLDC